MTTGNAGVWFTADHHLSHANVIRHGGRPFATVEQMNESLIQAWVDRVKPGDRVYHLGDVTWGRFEEIVDRLPGQLFLIMGNHDSQKTAKHSRWIWSRDAAYIKVEGQRIHMSHYAFETWRNSHYGSWHLHGHSHGSLPPRGRRMDVGVDTHCEYAPYSFEEVAAVMATRKFEAVDHHGKGIEGIEDV